MRSACAIVAAIVLAGAPTATTEAEHIQGRWRLLAAEDLRADGSVGRYPWGRHPVGSIVVQGGACYLQIMSSDTPGGRNARSRPSTTSGESAQRRPMASPVTATVK